MKTKILTLAILSVLTISSVFAQDRTTVTATNSDISDNLDLRAVASIFGDSKDLNDFERRLNDPQAQISNLDLNGDNRVDYLRVIETVEGNTHLIVIQSVLGMDTFQDIATVEVERDRYNKVQVQVVGDVYMYGNNYIYEPVYAYTPVIYTSFWVNHYSPYYSSWYWGYYPSFYVAWNPFPIYTYHSHINVYINHQHHYNYVNYRRCATVYNNYYAPRRGNAYERQNPSRSFAQRNTGFSNRRELVDNRRTQNATRTNGFSNGTRNSSATMGSTRGNRTANGTTASTTTPRNNGNVRSTESPRDTSVRTNSGNSSTRSYEGSRTAETPRNYGNAGSTRSNGNTANTETPRNYGNTGSTRSNGNTANTETPRSVASQGNTRSYEGQRNTSTRSEMPRAETPRNVQRNEPARSSGQREYSQQRGNSQRSEGSSRGNDGGSRGNRRG